jgi:hypothetical protein
MTMQWVFGHTYFDKPINFLELLAILLCFLADSTLLKSLKKGKQWWKSSTPKDIR